jgi:integrase
MQGGQVFQHGNYWSLRWREKVLVNGELKSVRKFKRLLPINQATKTDAQKLADEIVGKLPSTAPESIDTLAHFLEHTFMPNVYHTRKPATQQSYLANFRLVQSAPWFAKMRLAEIHTSHIHQFLKEIAERPARDGGKRGQSSITNCRTFLSIAVREAINAGLLRDNPVSAAITPKGRRAGETHAYTLAEIHAMLAALKHDRTACTLVLVASLTGLRKSEIQGLKWEDMDGEVLNVRRQYWNGQALETKTEDSAASVPLLPTVVEALAEHKSRSGFNGWCFHGKTGNPLRINEYTTGRIIPALERAGIQWHGWHAFRRGLSSNLVDLGVQPKIAQAILRHANVATTLKFYIKARPEVTAAEMGKLETAWKATMPAVKKRA